MKPLIAGTLTLLNHVLESLKEAGATHPKAIPQVPEEAPRPSNDVPHEGHPPKLPPMEEARMFLS